LSSGFLVINNNGTFSGTLSQSNGAVTAINGVCTPQSGNA